MYPVSDCERSVNRTIQESKRHYSRSHACRRGCDSVRYGPAVSRNGESVKMLDKGEEPVLRSDCYKAFRA